MKTPAAGLDLNRIRAEQRRLALMEWVVTVGVVIGALLASAEMLF